MSDEQKKVAVSAGLTEEQIQANREPARSVDATIRNRTSKTMILIRFVMIHGIMRSGPTDEIPPGGTGRFSAESSGFMTGTEGYVYYRIESVSGDVSLYFNNPFYGSNSYDISTPAGFSGSISGGGGNNAKVTYTIRED